MLTRVTGLYQVGRRIALASVIVSAVLSVAKIAAGILGHSTAVVADGVESAGDILASGLVLLAMTLAARPPDEEHPYGHGRLETLTGLAVGFLLTGSGIVIGLRSLDGLREVPVMPARFTLWALAGSVLTKAFTFQLKWHYSTRLKSDSLRADAWNDAVDILSGLVATVAVVLSLMYPSRLAHADNYGGFAIGLLIIALGARVIRETALQLMDTMPGPPMMAEIRAAALQVPGVQGVEKCFARKTGLQYHVDLHLEVNGNLTVRDSHAIAKRVREALRQNIDWVADVLVHVEPHEESSQAVSRLGA